MSDFIYTSSVAPDGMVETLLRCIPTTPTATRTCRGGWGQLTLLENHYPGFAPYEDEKHLLLVTGGPLLRLPGKATLAPVEGTTADDDGLSAMLLKRWLEGEPDWGQELSGPFIVLLLEKATGRLTLVTDPMSMAPVYQAESAHGDLVIGTHPDLVALQAGRFKSPDPVSMVDLLVNRTICYPHTLYEGVRELAPGSRFRLQPGHETQNRLEQSHYWLPEEQQMEQRLADAALRLREAFTGYINPLCQPLEKAALFISGGEDSRAIAGALPQKLERHGFVFVDQPNRESAIAMAVARKLGITPHLAGRTPDRYVRNLPGCTRLVGAQHDFVHVHAFGYEQECGLRDFPAVMGGLYADIFLKALNVPKRRFQRFGVALPERGIVTGRQAAGLSIDSWYGSLEQARKFFKGELVDEMHARRLAHYDRVVQMRPCSAAEWAQTWPLSQVNGNGDLTGNRRLFRSFEVFTDVEIVKLSARVPLWMKLNRRLFQAAMKPFLRKTWYLPHAGNGHFPYFSVHANPLLRPLPILYWKLKERITGTEPNPGPWPVYDAVVTQEAMTRLEQQLLTQQGDLLQRITTREVTNRHPARWMTPLQRLQLAEVLWSRDGMRCNDGPTGEPTP